MVETSFAGWFAERVLRSVSNTCTCWYVVKHKAFYWSIETEGRNPQSRSQVDGCNGSQWRITCTTAVGLDNRGFGGRNKQHLVAVYITTCYPKSSMTTTLPVLSLVFLLGLSHCLRSRVWKAATSVPRQMPKSSRSLVEAQPLPSDWCVHFRCQNFKTKLDKNSPRYMVVLWCFMLFFIQVTDTFLTGPESWNPPVRMEFERLAQQEKRWQIQHVSSPRLGLNIISVLGCDFQFWDPTFENTCHSEGQDHGIWWNLAHEPPVVLDMKNLEKGVTCGRPRV